MTTGKPRVRTQQVSFRMPIGIYEGMLEVMDRERLWSRPQFFVFQAMQEYIDKYRKKWREEGPAEKKA